MLICLAVSTQYRRVTGRRSDGQTSCDNIRAMHTHRVVKTTDFNYANFIVVPQLMAGENYAVWSSSLARKYMDKCHCRLPVVPFPVPAVNVERTTIVGWVFWAKICCQISLKRYVLYCIILPQWAQLNEKVTLCEPATQRFTLPIERKVRGGGSSRVIDVWRRSAPRQAPPTTALPVQQFRWWD